MTALDPAQNYLRLERTVHGVKQSGSNYRLTLTRGGETGTLEYTVSGQ